MQKDVIISVKGTQTDSIRGTNALELVTEGKYYKNGDTYFLTYNESKVTGMEGTTTTLVIDSGIVTLMRVGSINSQFIFQKGQKHMSHYDTSYGAFTVGVFANEVKVNVDDGGGEIRVGYEIEINNTKSGENDFLISIREAGNAKNGYKGRNKKGNHMYS